MNHHFKKFFLVFVSLCMVSSISAMKTSCLSDEHKKDEANKTFRHAITLLQKNGCLQQRHLEKIQESLQQGADLNYKFSNLHGQTAIMIAAGYRQKNLLDLLYQYGADVNIGDDYGWTALHYLSLSKFHNPIDEQIVEGLLQNGASLNAKGENGQFPLSEAVVEGNKTFIKLVTQQYHNKNIEVDFNEKKNGNFTPLALAIVNNCSKDDKIEIIKMLCKARASVVDVSSERTSAFHFAGVESQSLIKTLITNVRFDDEDNQEQYVNAKKRFIETFLVLRQRSIPLDLIFLLLSKLAETKGVDICLLSSIDFKSSYIFAQINKRVLCLKEILQMKNTKNQTALQFFLSAQPFIDEHHWNKNQLVEPLLNGTELDNHFNEFRTAFPEISKIPKNNLALQMYNNCSVLLEEENDFRLTTSDKLL